MNQNQTRSIAVFATLVAASFATEASATSIPLFTDNFESYTSIPLNLPTAEASVSGDPSQIVGASTQGIDTVTPRSGSQMVRFVNTYHLEPETDGTNGDLYYFLDMDRYAGVLAGGPATVELSAYFNTGATGIHNDGSDPNFGIVDNAYFLGLRAWDETANFPYDIKRRDPASELAAVNNYDNPLITDRDPLTWEQSAIRLGLPAGTRYLTLRFAAHENLHENDGEGEDFVSSFADDLQLNLLLPDSFIEDPVENVPASGSTIVFLGTALASLSMAGARKGRKAP